MDEQYRYSHLCDEALDRKLRYTLDCLDTSSSTSFSLEATLAELMAEKARRKGHV